MRWARVVAIVLTGICVVGIGLVSMGIVGGVGELVVRGSGSEHVQGVIVQVTYQTETRLRVRTNEGEELTFICQKRCLEQVQHIERHLTNGASTDVYFVHGVSNELIAVDVD
jgi:hypothetical protein